MKLFSLKQLAALYLLAGLLTAFAATAPMNDATLGFVHDTETSTGNRMVSATNVTTAPLQAWNYSKKDFHLTGKGNHIPDVSIHRTKTFSGIYPPGEPQEFYNVSVKGTKNHNATARIHYHEENLSAPETTLSFWHFEDGRWHMLKSSVDTKNDYVEANLTSFSTFALVEAYADAFDDGNRSRDWSPVGEKGYWYNRTHGNLVQASNDTGIITNHVAAGNATNYSATVDMEMAGEDENFMSLLLRTDNSGESGIEARLDWDADTVGIGHLKNGTYFPDTTRSYTLSDNVPYRVKVTANGENVTLEINEITASGRRLAPTLLTASSPEFDTGYRDIGLKGQDGSTDDKNLFDNFVVEYLR